MATKRSYEMRLSEKDISHTVAEAWPELVRYQDDYYRLLEDYNALKEKTQSAEKKVEDRRVKMNELYEKLDTCRVTVKNLGDQVQSLENQLQELKSNPVGLPKHEELVLENKHLQQELDYYVGRARFALYGKDDWDDDEDCGGLPMLPEEIPQDVPVRPPTKLAHPVGKSHWNESKVVHEAGIPAIGGSHLPPAPKRISADPPAAITGALPRPLGKAQAERWDQPALRGTSDWIMEANIHDSEIRRLYIKGRSLQPHLQSPYHTAVIFRIDEYAKSLPGLPCNLVVRHDDPGWMINVVQAFNANPSGIPRNLRLKGLHVNVDDADVWYWLNLIKPKFRGAEVELLLQSIFSTVGKWDQMTAGQWKRNDSLFLCSPTPARYQINRNQKFDRRAFTYWLGCDAGVTPALARDKLEPYFVRHATKTIWNEHTAGSSSLADKLDYGEGGSFSHPPADAHELWARVSYFDSLVPQGTACESTAEITEALTHDMYTDNHE
ncbi:hypothetical protein M422DRAFT_267555 [Sphaerobolus stellatus SS14]|uniref:Uncharacterized protein n=1 Tax=Sphaerobolus stellatus (strain SS14) TaxID=990650 RepID=A0A0C9UZQ6_SPHS4|nr:hypothetical protein M422DRAFT_267555 [Sphaerobolus stellatus SS14]